MLLLEGPKKQPRGRPRFEPNDTQRQMVEQLKACGITDQAIADILHINLRTLKRAFKMELGTACTRMVHKSMTNLVAIASRANGGFAAVAANKLILEYMERQGIMVGPVSTSIPGSQGEIRILAEIPRNGRE